MWCGQKAFATRDEETSFVLRRCAQYTCSPSGRKTIPRNRFRPANFHTFISMETDSPLRACGRQDGVITFHFCPLREQQFVKARRTLLKLSSLSALRSCRMCGASFINCALRFLSPSSLWKLSPESK